MKKILACVLALALGLSFASAKAVPLGKAAEYTILIPETPSKQEKYSAKVLAEYLEKLYKVKVPVQQEGKTVSGNVISVGETALAKKNGLSGALKPQGYEFTVKGKNLFLRGGFPGPLNGVITYLEEDLGCRRYAEPFSIGKYPEPGEMMIPDLQGKPLHVTPRSYTPQFTMREIRYLLGWAKPDPNYVMYFRLSPITSQSYMPEESGGGLNATLYVHTYARLFPKKYYDTNPEYFALQRGKRTRMTSTFGSVCYTHPRVPEIMADEIRKEIQKFPDARYFSVSCTDCSETGCDCPKCAPIIKQYGLPGIQIMLANKVAEILCKDYPEIQITSLVYGSTALTTNGYKAHPNVTLFVAPIGARYNVVQMLIPLSENKVVCETLNNCKKSSSNLFFWDYLDTASMPFPNFDQVRDSIRFLANEKMTGYSIDCSNGGMSLSPLKKYLYTHLVWDPQTDIEPLIAEFIPAFYKEAAPEITEYVKLLRNAWRNFKNRYDKANGVGVVLEYTSAEKEKMRQLLDSALAKAEKDPVLKGRIAREYLVYLNMRLTGNPKVIGVEQYEKDYNLLEKLIVYARWDSEIAKNKKRIKAKLKWAKSPPDKDLYSPNTVIVLKPIYGGNNGYKDDPTALNGKASRHHGKRPWGIQWNYGLFIDFLVPGTTYVMRLRARQECDPIRTSGGMFDLWTFHHGHKNLNKQGGFHADFTKEDAKGEYRWITLGKVKFENPSATGMFWMNSLVDLDEAIWYDRMELIPINEYKEKDPIPEKTLIL